jgi:PTH1 family peptidyl-tRNA hydrolase
VRFLPSRTAGGSLDLLVVGLGNPGTRYARTRHNVGRMAVEYLADRLGLAFGQKHDGRFVTGRLDDVRLALLVPETFMNDSGRSIGKAARFHKLDLAQVVVVYDEVELPFGRVKARAGGGLKGHNGLRSTAQALGGPDFLRVRCGIGRPERGDRRPLADWLLAPFEAHEDPAPLVERGAECTEVLVREGLDEAERRFP